MSQTKEQRMERLIIEGPGADIVSGDVVANLWDLTRDFPVFISVFVDVEEGADIENDGDLTVEEKAAVYDEVMAGIEAEAMAESEDITNGNS